MSIIVFLYIVASMFIAYGLGMILFHQILNNGIILGAIFLALGIVTLVFTIYDQFFLSKDIINVIHKLY